ncbi:aromatic-L-amino-acid decarboxylase isoform X3 [Octopus bimaculoides]|uniref:aromatic-L-amino-acid decarboxylase isoform X3 n=1 Tax=Octopus bimaculoides TaxID=37653 RepID=UPI0022E8CFF8|nr:aromatic-L-amino-acid decarboxylase isoform X3 [Octopus bimaculoides]
MENAENFEAAAVELAKYITDYFNNIRSRKVLPVCAPGFLRILITDRAPEKAEPWDDVFADIERIIMSGICHWQHPRFASFFPSRTSYAAILGGMFSNALATDVISWKSFPAATELEVIVLDWLAKAIKLPKIFLSTSEGDGGGVIQNSSTECMLMSLFAARTASINKMKTENNEMEDWIAVTKLIAYKSEETHSSFVKACKIALIKVRDIELDDRRSMRGNSLKKAIEEDRAKGCVPFYICSTLGTTSVCAFDNIKEIGAVCKDEGIWLHIDAAYAGNAFICPEYRYLMNGVEYADSICVSPHKWLQVPTGCSVLWLQNSNKLVDSIPEPGEYLQCTQNSEMPNFTKWQIPCGRPFTSLKLWFVLRLIGIRQLQKIIRKGSNEINEELIKSITLTREIHIGCSKIDDNVFLRFVVHAYQATIEDINYSYKLIAKLADQVLHSQPKPRTQTSKDCLKCMISIFH